MSRIQTYRWIAADAAAISALQSLGAAGNLLINGTLASKNGPPVYVEFVGISRRVTLTSANNLSAVNFTVTGVLGNTVVNEVIAGPNANTVTTVSMFDKVTQISTAAAVNAVSAGTGQTGATHWYFHDYNRSVSNVGVQAVITGNITYSYEVTLNDLQASETPTTFTPIVAMTAANTNQLGSLTTPVAYSRIEVTASVGAATLTESIIQQGVT